MEQICRTCMTKSLALVDIFTDQREPSLSAMISECVASVKIKLNDGLPQKICLSCIRDIQTAFAFKRRCEKSYQVLDEKLKKKNKKLDAKNLEVPKDETGDLLSTEGNLHEERDNDNNCISTKSSTVAAPNHSPSRLQQKSSEVSIQSELLEIEPWELSEPEMDIGCIKVEKEDQPDESIPQTDEANNQEELDFSAVDDMSPSTDGKKFQFTCPHCPKSFSQKCHLNSHIRTHTGERPYQCPHCPKAFSQASNLRKHICIHSGERPFKCPHCMRGFTRHTDLQYHVSTHPGKQTYKCQNCTRYFIEESELEEHMRYHKGERTYKCQLCPREYVLAWQLQRHIRAHTGEQPFKCPHCPKNCVDKGELGRHIRSHTGERPHKCPQCPNAFTRASYLKTHINTHIESS
ncbi:zinc finger protein 572 [Drosophila hydei]|uniref:Zinc finger protein 572 n=1 Tax=Drosophila hydei TaxID=7224 RepID=A0A6J1LTW2_DROHY|nr:zinc finger protein 572 [Drosophila hydei]